MRFCEPAIPPQPSHCVPNFATASSASSLRYQRLRALLSPRYARALRVARLPVAISMERAHPAEECRLDAAHMRALQEDSAMSTAELAILSALVAALLLAALATAMRCAERRHVLVSSP